MSDLMVLDMGELAMPFDATQAAELTKNMTAGFGGQFHKAARLSMGNSGDWELIDEEGEVHDMGREVNIVIVDQREFISRVHYAKSFDEMKVSGEFDAPDCKSYNGETPDVGVEKPYSDKCKSCQAFETSGQLCGYYRRVVGVIAYEDGTFSDPFVFEPKAKSLFDKTIVKERYGSYGWYMNLLASQKRNGVPMPIPTQAIVTKCMPMPKMEVATIKFGVASTSAGGYWSLNKEQFEEILRLKDSDEVKDMLKPFNAATNNPSSAGRIHVKDVTDEPKVETVAEEPKAKSAPAPEAKSASAKKEAPKAKVKKVVLGLEHPDVKNSEEFDYEDIVEWAKDADETEVKEWLAENFPQALEPVEVADETQVEEPVKEEPKAKKAPVKRAKPTETKTEENVVDTSGKAVDPEMAKQAEQLAGNLEDFDD